MTPPAGHTLVFEDNFDGAALDVTKWKPTSSFTDGLNHTQYNWKSGYGAELWDPGRITLEGGSLVLTATADRHAGEVRSVGSWGFGYYECRAKLPGGGPGFWVALWTLSATGSYQEIDFAECDSNVPRRIGENLHWGDAANHPADNGGYLDPVINYQADFHSYGARYLDDRIEFYVDDVLRRTWLQHTPREFTDPMRVLLSLSIFDAAKQPYAAPPGPSTAWPGVLLVDWVRVWLPGAGPAPTPSPTPTGDTTPPLVTILEPMAGVVVPRKSSVTVLAAATDNVAVARVEFLVNGTLRDVAIAAPYSFTFPVGGKPNAQYRVEAVAYDAAGNHAAASVYVRTP